MRDVAGNVVPYEDTESYYDRFTASFELGSEFSTRECHEYGPKQDATIICKIRPKVANQQLQNLQLADIDGKSFSSMPQAVMVQPSLFLKVSKEMLQIQQTSDSVSIKYSLIDVYGNNIHQISQPPCSYFKHGALLYSFGMRQQGQKSKLSLSQEIELKEEQSNYTFSIRVTNTDPKQIYIVDYALYQGLLHEDGLDVKYYTTDNFQRSDLAKDSQHGTPQDIEIITQSLITQKSDSAKWFEYHRERDRFSVKFSALVKPPCKATYFFSVPSGLVQNMSTRKSGIELWIDNYLVIQDDKTSTQGQVILHGSSFAHIKLLYRVTQHSVGQVPQFFINWQSSCQMMSTLKPSDIQIVALDPEETEIAKETTFAKDSFTVGAI